MISPEKRKDLEKQGYRIVGSHSAIKVCLWTKRAIRCEDVCYKNTFYGIKSWRCVQMTPALPFCTLRCDWCWRDIGFTKKEWHGKIDNPSDIIDGCIKEHVNYLIGFQGNEKADKRRLAEAMRPLHFAISLSGEPTLYPKLPELIREIKKRKMTAFLVTNGTNPEMLEKLSADEKFNPTQTYLTLSAPDEDTFKQVCHPLIDDGWNKIRRSLALIKKFPRSTIRLTLAKGSNMGNAEGYAQIIKETNPDFVECKAYVWVGYSRYRLDRQAMPRHEEIKRFAGLLSKSTGYKIIDEKPESRVVLMAKRDDDDRAISS